jgi:hypothetical protein
MRLFFRYRHTHFTESLHHREPTSEQLKQLYRVLTWLTRMYLPIYLLTLDERTDNIVVIAGEETVVVINLQAEVDYE